MATEIELKSKVERGYDLISHTLQTKSLSRSHPNASATRLIKYG